MSTDPTPQSSSNTETTPEPQTKNTISVEDKSSETIQNETRQPALEGDALKEAILKQVEFYFSQQNLATDGFLVSQMDENRYVLLSLIASFTKLKSITTDINLIIESLKNSTVVELSPDNQKIKPKESKKRNTLILHNLPEGTTDDDLQKLFLEGNFTPQLKSEVNQCWFVTFENEQQTTAALQFIRQQKIKGETIRARIKPEPLLRTVDVPIPIVHPPAYNYQAYPRASWAPWDPNDVNPNFTRGVDSSRSKYRKPRNKDFRKDQKSNRGRNGNRGKKPRDKKPSSFQLAQSQFPPLPKKDAEKQNAAKSDNEVATDPALVQNNETSDSDQTESPTKAKESPSTSSWSQIVKETKKENVTQSTEEDPK